MRRAGSFPAIDELLPHRGDMLLADRVLDCDEVSAVTEYTPRRAAWYAADDGAMPAWLGIELMAQAIAVHVGMRKRLAGLPPALGALLGTRRFAATVSAFDAGQPLRIEAKLNFRDESGLGAYECAIADGARQLATATVKVFEPDDFSTFLATGYK